VIPRKFSIFLTTLGTLLLRFRIFRLKYVLKVTSLVAWKFPRYGHADRKVAALTKGAA
jgi:hypothetical protein